MSNPAIIIILTTIASICMLYYGASFLISGALSAASKFKISDTVVSITLIAGATSLPELFILFQAIHNPGGSTLAYGTILGSNFANIGLVLGISILISFKDKFSFNFSSFIPYLLISLCATFIFCMYGLNIENLWVKKLFSIVMILLIFLYIHRLKKETGNYPEIKDVAVVPKRKIFLFILSGAGLLALGSGFLVHIGSELQLLGISSAIIGSIYFALASSSPEIFTSLFAIFKYKKYDVVVGNVIGSNLANIFIFGLITLIFNLESINIPLQSLALLSALEIGLFCIFFIYFISNKKEKIVHLHSVVGFLLISVYYLFYKFL